MTGNKSGNATNDREKATQAERKGGQNSQGNAPKEREKATGTGGKGEKASPGGRK